MRERSLFKREQFKVKGKLPGVTLQTKTYTTEKQNFYYNNNSLFDVEYHDEKNAKKLK